MDQPVNIKEITFDEFKNINKNDIEFVSLRDGSLGHVIDENNTSSGKNIEKIIQLVKLGEKQYEYETQIEIIPPKIQHNNNVYKDQNNNNSFNEKIIGTNYNEISCGDIVEERSNYRLFVSGAGRIEKNPPENNGKFCRFNEIEENNYKMNNQINHVFENNLNNYQSNKIQLKGKMQGVLKSESPKSKKIQFYRVIKFSSNNLNNNDINTKNLKEYNNINSNNTSVSKSMILKEKDYQSNYDYQNKFKLDSSTEDKIFNDCPSQSKLIEEDSSLDILNGSNSIKIVVEKTKRKKKNSKKEPEYLDNYGYLEVKEVSQKRFKKYL